jgi:hypothetical protein
MRTFSAMKCGIGVLFIVAAIAVAGTFAGTARAGQQPSVGTGRLPNIPANELVRRTVGNELKASQQENTSYMYKNRRQTPNGSKTKLMIETKDGTIAYLIAVNDRPLTPEEKSAEQQRIQGLVSNPSEQERKKKEQQQDSDRVTKLFRELPSGFNYQYAGTMPGDNGHEWVKLKFTPNPNYQSPSRETSVFKAMSGDMVIDPTAERLVKIEATLFRDVTFGWGLLGHLDKGGHFFVQQSNIGDHRWEPTYMNIQFTGKALLFKTINLKQIETASDFVRVPDNLTAAQGVDMLRKRVEDELASNGRGKK